MNLLGLHGFMAGCSLLINFLIIIIKLYYFISLQITGWRSGSLRMLMHISDAPIHVAGDGLVYNNAI